MSVVPQPWPLPAPQVAEAVAVMYRGKRERPLPVLVRDKLGEWLADEQFAGAYGVRGKPGWPPSRLALVTVFQKAEDLTDRQAAECVRTRIDWKYALGLDLADPGFDHSVLTWRMPASETKKAQLALAYGRDGHTLLTAVHAAAGSDPDLAFLARLHQVEVLRVVLLQNYLAVENDQGREVIRRREADAEGLPPGRSRITSPYDLDARWGVKRDTFWNGYKVHVTETCDTSAAADDDSSSSSDGDGEAVAPPHLITNVETTDATVPDSQMTEPIHARLAGRGLLPAEHYVDSGYPSAELLVSSLVSFGIALVTPMLADTSPQARAGAGFDRTAFSLDFDARQATCPQGHPSSSWNPVAQRGTGTIVITFAKRTCGPCPVRAQCTTSTSGRRQLTVHPRDVHQAQLAARAAQATKDFEARYALRAGVEDTIRQGVAVTGIRHARYRGLTRTRLEHASAAVAVNLIRLHAWWNGHPLNRTRTSHLARLELALAS